MITLPRAAPRGPFHRKSPRAARSIPLITAGMPVGSFTFSRSSSAWTFDNVNGLRQSAVNVFRRQNNRLFLEGARTNMVRNPRAEGSAPGSPGTAPTYWAITSIAGVAASILPIVTELGMPCLDVRFAGTATASGYLTIVPEQAAAVPASTGQMWSGSLLMRLAAGSLTGIDNLRIRIQERLPAAGPASDVFVVPTSTWQRFFVTRTLTDAGATSVGFSILPFVSSGSVVDVTFRVALPQLEMGAFSSSPILPLVGAPAAATRAQDRLSYLQATWLKAMQGTFAVNVLFSQAVGEAGRDARVFEASDGTAANAVRAQVRRLTNAIDAQTVLAGTAAGRLLASYNVNQVNRLLMAYDAAYLYGAANGQTREWSYPANAPAALNRLDVGASFNGANPLWAEIESLTYWPVRKPLSIVA